jgi:hypothetical protein
VSEKYKTTLNTAGVKNNNNLIDLQYEKFDTHEFERLNDLYGSFTVDATADVYDTQLPSFYLQQN